ncbi:GNAT family N-acetyltransferase [Microbacterium hominis]|uniref:GNAT family N-acetyltransferase n=1 Tax=Microbacterium TaxID=33882 RepID=UPI00168AE37E|nr:MULTISPECIES: GNAT family protein [Microbacterium]QOC26895.1 GNAT family N-acetyltransferase [Microbacterium hominis]QOC28061.1 GNAT family N-acetyltransferase [Microbacterium hominis]QYF96771.1 GNAT family N-acetyltransferase [Microbacterium sp. PAMC21962]
MPHAPLVTLRARTAADVDALYRLTADLETWEERTPSRPSPVTRSAFEKRLTDTASGPGTRSIEFVIDVDGAAVGSVSLFGFDDLARHAEIGIAVLAEHRGRGIGTAALAKMVTFAFVRCNLRRVHLQAISSNVGAIRVYEKAGFEVEGRLREHAWVRGAYEDMVVLGLLRTDWERTDR